MLVLAIHASGHTVGHAVGLVNLVNLATFCKNTRPTA